MTDKAVDQPDFFYEDRFLESWVGSIISDPSTAIVELVANCWDAYATDVKITWPDKRNNRPFSGDRKSNRMSTSMAHVWGVSGMHTGDCWVDFSKPVARDFSV